MTPENFIKAHLAYFAHREAFHHGGIDNMLAVACVIRNRVKAGWFNGDWLECIQKAESVRGTYYEPKPLNLRDVTTRLLLAAVDDVYSGLYLDKSTMGALYYAELHQIDSEWFQENVLTDVESHPRVAQVGQVSFFK